MLPPKSDELPVQNSINKKLLNKLIKLTAVCPSAPLRSYFLSIPTKKILIYDIDIDIVTQVLLFAFPCGTLLSICN